MGKILYSKFLRTIPGVLGTVTFNTHILSELLFVEFKYEKDFSILID